MIIPRETIITVLAFITLAASITMSTTTIIADVPNGLANLLTLMSALLIAATITLLFMP